MREKSCLVYYKSGKNPYWCSHITFCCLVQWAQSQTAFKYLCLCLFIISAAFSPCQRSFFLQLVSINTESWLANVMKISDCRIFRDIRVDLYKPPGAPWMWGEEEGKRNGLGKERWDTLSSGHEVAATLKDSRHLCLHEEDQVSQCFRVDGGRVPEALPFPVNFWLLLAAEKVGGGTRVGHFPLKVWPLVGCSCGWPQTKKGEKH